MRIGIISDLHGIYPDTKNWPKLDLLLIGGDLFKDYRTDIYKVIAIQQKELEEKFNPWLNSIPLSKERKIITAGNHCHVLEHHGLKSQDFISGTYLQNTSTIVDGLTIWGTPYSYYPPDYPGHWSFGASEDTLTALYESIPKDIHVLMSHTPPFGEGDIGWGGSKKGMCNFGSKALRAYLDQSDFPLKELKLIQFSHIHEWGNTITSRIWWDRKEERRRKIIVANGAADPFYNPTQALTFVDI